MTEPELPRIDTSNWPPADSFTDPGAFEEWLNAELMRSYKAHVAANFPCIMCGQVGHDPEACVYVRTEPITGILGGIDLAGPWLAERATTLPLDVHKVTAYVEVTHDALLAFGDHACDASCLALYGNAYVRPRPSRRDRLRRGLWRAVWRVRRLGGLRIAHRDRIDQDRDD